MNIFDHENYKKYVTTRIKAMPKNGHGQYRKIAHFLNINSVNVTQIFKGDRELSLEQASLLSEYFGLSELETDYFLGLVEYARAGHHKLKSHIRRRLDEILKKSSDIKNRIPVKAELSDADKALFYSNWLNSGVRLLTSIEGFQNRDEIAKYFNISLAKTNEILELLLRTGLCKDVDGKIIMGPSSTHLPASSPLVQTHHRNWRMKAIQRHEYLTNEELSLSMPCSLSVKATKQIRTELLESIDRIAKHIDYGPEEKLACLNIDWIWI